MRKMMRIHPADTVAVALQDCKSGEKIILGDETFTLREDVPFGHKAALREHSPGEPVKKYGYPIGRARVRILPGEHVHTHNTATQLDERVEYSYNPKGAEAAIPAGEPLFFEGYPRADGRVGTRNEIWVIPTVGCVNQTALRVAKRAHEERPAHIDGVYAFPHPYGCSQMGEDQSTTQMILAALAKHPNAAGALILGLGCENNHIAVFRPILGEFDPRRIRFMETREVHDEDEAAHGLLTELFAASEGDARVRMPVSKLRIGMKCGGSDALSGITANPLCGVISDRMIAGGASVMLTEVPEMFGAEKILMERAENRGVFDGIVGLIEGYKRYFAAHGQVVYENPSPGNKQGGITTLEDKSLGCIQKGGRTAVRGLAKIGAEWGSPGAGLYLLDGPGNDLVSCTNLTAAGAQIILFTTGRGTPFGAPVPTVKIASNTRLAKQKPNWIDFSAGEIPDGESMEQAADRLMETILAVASGRETRNERGGFREIAIFKDGVTL